MADFYVTADGGSESEVTPVAKAIEAEGFSVETGVTGPNAEALRNNGTVKPPTKLVFICNGGIAGQTYGSFALDYSDGMCFTIFAFDNYRTHFNTTTEDALHNEQLVSEGDSGDFATEAAAKDFSGHTCCSYQEKHPEVFAFVTSETSAEDLGKKIAHGDYTCGGSGTSGSTVSSGGGAQIKDKTFEKCIRRICAATDSVFIVENNAAVLFPYTDWLAFTLREKISTISAKEIDPNVFSTEYTTEGFYNKVTIAWGGAQLPERFPNNPIMHEAYVQKQQTQSTEEKPNTTTTITTNTDGSTLISEQYDALVKKYGELEKRVESPVADLETAQYLVNALLIQYVREFNNACQCRSLANRKYIGGTFYVVTNPFTKEQEMQYLNGYTTRTQKGQPIYFDLDFRYGPESAEELLDYQAYSGGSAAGGSSGAAGGEAADINEIAKIACKGISDPLEKAKAIHEYLKQYIRYKSYSCSNSEWGKDPSKIWKAVKDTQAGTNCADTANLTSAVMRAAGLNAEVVHGPNHFWTVVTINGKEYASDLVWSEGQLSGRPFNEVYNHLSYYDKCGKTASC